MEEHVQLARGDYEAALGATSLATSILIKADKEVEVHRHSNGVYYVRFQWHGTPVNRSCRTKDRRTAYPIARRIRRDYIFNESQGKPTMAAANKERKLNDVIKLYESFCEESDKAPSPATAKKYIQQLRGWVKVLGVKTVSELEQEIKDHSLKKENARRKKLELRPLNKGGYASSLRGAAAVFSTEAVKYYKRRGFYVENPLAGEVPKGDFEKFIVPPGGLDFITELFQAAEKEISAHQQMYPIFLLALGAGLRAQEATHASWKHVNENGVYVRNDDVHRTKSNEPRIVPAGPSLKERLLELKPDGTGLDDFIAPDLRSRTTGTGDKKYKKRCDRALKQLNKWLRANGVTRYLTSHPCHYLRKLFGASILTNHPQGLQLAKKYLGHQTTDITERIYVDLLDTPEIDVLPEIGTEPQKEHE